MLVRSLGLLSELAEGGSVVRCGVRLIHSTSSKSRFNHGSACSSVRVCDVFRLDQAAGLLAIGP